MQNKKKLQDNEFGDKKNLATGDRSKIGLKIINVVVVFYSSSLGHIPIVMM